MTSYAQTQKLASHLKERTPDARGEAEERIFRLVTSIRWQFAATMPHSPHEYSVLKWRPELQAEFVWCATYIVKYGKVERWGEYWYSYYYLRGHKYWTMDDLLQNTALINRASTTDIPCRFGVVCEH
jgi:hypothetical protein